MRTRRLYLVLSEVLALLSIVGDKLVWKNAQKNDTKNKTSDTMNRIIPHRSPFVTIFVCNPW